MSWVLGVFGGTTSFEKNRYLKDGNACLLKDGRIFCAIAEERISRIKHDGNYSRAVRYCLEAAGIGLEDIELVVFSNCCDLPLDPHSSNGLGISSNRVSNIPSHHFSHAYLAQKMSGFNDCNVIVMDNEGNIIGEKTDHEYYWKNRLERNSYYCLSNRELSLFSRDCEDVDTIGVGDTYHYFTHYLGWHSYTFAGRVMGLAAYGNREAYKQVELFAIDGNGNIRSNIRNNRIKKELEVRKTGWRFGVDFGPPRLKGEGISRRHENLSALIQNAVERCLKYKVLTLAKQIPTGNICFSGGVGYNCLANRTIYDLPAVDRIFVPYCPGDEGQSIGNALWGFCEVLGGDADPSIKSPFNGKPYSQKIILETLQSFKGLISWEKRADFLRVAAEEIANGKIIGWFQGRSECGNRALGNRSILADPRIENIQPVLNRIKGRESFRPFSPSILAEHSKEYFGLDIECPYMSTVGFATELAKSTVSGVIHVDGSSRIQTVRSSDNEVLHDLISEFLKMTGVPLLVNTSFNISAEPIVESPTDGISSFLRMDLDMLVIDKYVIYKRSK